MHATKITVVGAGNVGATCADVIAQKGFATEVVLLDIKKGLAEGKALDIWQTASIASFDTKTVGSTGDYYKTKDSDVIIVTSGIPRKPGMSRDDLISTNAKIVKEVTEKSIEHSPNAIFIVVSNPLDVMTYAAYLAANVPSNRVFGMAGILDIGRFKSFISEAIGIAPRNIQALLLGGHGDTMVPLPRYTTVSGIPVTHFISEEELTKIVERTKMGGGEIVELLGTSAWYAPGAAAAQMAEAVVKNENSIFPVCAYLNGEFGLRDIYLGVPVKLGREGVRKIIEIPLNEAEKALLYKSAEHVRVVMKVLDDMKMF